MAKAETSAAAAADRAVRDLILVLADSKRLLGMRYAEWILGAPELEAGIACASMAQDEWGHARLLYALLKEHGDDVARLEHERPAAEYRNIEALDRPTRDWPELVALNALVDTALSVQLEALRESSATMLRQRVGKILDEERFHAAHGAAWFRRLAGASPAARDSLVSVVDAVLPAVVHWFGPDSESARALRAGRIADAVGDELRAAFAERVAELLDRVDRSGAVRDPALDFTGFDEARRRRTGAGAGPDEETIVRVRGDRNRAFLLE